MTVIEMLHRDFALTPVIATEIEFYLHGAGTMFTPQQVIDVIRQECDVADIPLASVEQERGSDQYEIALQPSNDYAGVITDTERFKALIAGVFARCGVVADFSAKPLAHAPGSGLHVHVHLENDSGKNVFYREGEEFSPQLLHAIGGLLAFMNPCMNIFAPTEESYARFTEKSNAPTTVSWGPNNRTVAIRLPTKPMDSKHIEHRVAGADANAGQVIAAILAGIHYGLAQKCDPGKPTYGDAALEQYGLPALARDLKEAQNFMLEYKALTEYPLY